MAKLAQIILIDSVNTEGPEYAVKRSQRAGRAPLRGGPGLAALDPVARARGLDLRPRASGARDLGSISSVTVRHKPDSAMAGLPAAGLAVLAAGLGAGPDDRAQGRRRRATPRPTGTEIKLTLEPDDTMTAPGLAGITVESASGMSISLDRGPGGLTAHRATPTARSRPGPSRAPRAASRGSSARASARRCCATTPTRRRWPPPGRWWPEARRPDARPRDRDRRRRGRRGGGADRRARARGRAHRAVRAAPRPRRRTRRSRAWAWTGRTPRSGSATTAPWAPTTSTPTTAWPRRACWTTSRAPQPAVHRIQGELGPHEAAAAYEDELRERFGERDARAGPAAAGPGSRRPHRFAVPARRRPWASASGWPWGWTCRAWRRSFRA